jgi:hypothetical protein
MHAQTSGSTVSGDDIPGQLAQLRQLHPELYARTDAQRVAAWQATLGRTLEQHDDFGDDAEGGRGVVYLKAQALNTRARATGIRSLLGLAAPRHRAPGGERPVLVDLLGGDGLIRKVCEELDITDFDVLTCDASPHMVAAAWAAGMPALLQRAEQPLLRDASVAPYSSPTAPTTCRPPTGRPWRRRRIACCAPGARSSCTTFSSAPPWTCGSRR